LPELTHGNVLIHILERRQIMADLEVKFHENRFEIISQVFCCEIHDTWENRKVWFVILRSLCSPATGKPFFSYQRIADAFAYQARQNINNYIREYAECDENLFDYLRHKRKVDPVVVNAVREELGQHVLAKTGELRDHVNQRLGRNDITSAHIRVALEQIPCTTVRQSVLREIAEGAFHPKEEVVLAEVFAALEHETGRGKTRMLGAWAAQARPVLPKDVVVDTSTDAVTRGTERPEAKTKIRPVYPDSCPDAGKLVRYAEIASHAGHEAMREAPDEALIQKTQAACVEKLLTPKRALSEIPDPVVHMVKAMAMYYSGASLSQLGRWFGGKAKSTMYTWIIGLALALWSVIRGWVWSHVKGTRQSIDEKWLKIRKKWHYLFVSVDHTSGLPVFHEVLPTRTKWACRLFLVKLKRLGKIPSVIITDGLKGYGSAIANVFPRAKHLLCVFHQQQSVTRWVNTQFCETETKEANAAKKRMKHVVQTHDTRTVNRRLNRLEHTANEKGWKIMEWITQTRDKLKHLLPAVRANSYPSTTNEIERFFRAFARFYKTRCGFHSVRSAKREIIFFMVVYLFTIHAESGKAPIEKIIPEANAMPLYHLLNYPFAVEMSSQPPQNVKPGEDMATESAEEAA
jgi:transposase-like protein